MEIRPKDNCMPFQRPAKVWSQHSSPRAAESQGMQLCMTGHVLGLGPRLWSYSLVDRKLQMTFILQKS